VVGVLVKVAAVWKEMPEHGLRIMKKPSVRGHRTATIEPEYGTGACSNVPSIPMYVKRPETIENDTLTIRARQRILLNPVGK
jgi:hypothetical protein